MRNRSQERRRGEGRQGYTSIWPPSWRTRIAPCLTPSLLPLLAGRPWPQSLPTHPLGRLDSGVRGRRRFHPRPLESFPAPRRGEQPRGGVSAVADVEPPPLLERDLFFRVGFGGERGGDERRSETGGRVPLSPPAISLPLPSSLPPRIAAASPSPFLPPPHNPTHQEGPQPGAPLSASAEREPARARASRDTPNRPAPPRPRSPGHARTGRTGQLAAPSRGGGGRRGALAGRVGSKISSQGGGRGGGKG